MDGRNPAVAFVGVCPGGKFPAAFLYGSDRTCCEREQDGFH